MAILKISSFILVIMLIEGNRLQEIKKIRKDMFVAYKDVGQYFTKYGLHNIYGHVIADVYLLFEDLGFYYVDRVVISCGETSIKKPKIALRGNMWNSRDYSSNCTNEAKDVLCPIEFECRGVYSFIWIDIEFDGKNESIQILDVEIFGYETNYYKYVGCFENSHFKKLEMVSDSGSCESICSDADFYGYDEEQHCVCIRGLPEKPSNFDFCHSCPDRHYIICGKQDSISVYSKDYVQNTHDFNPLLYPGCFNSISGCPICPDGMDGAFCTKISCKRSKDICGNKKCLKMFEDENGAIELCLCGDGYYMDERLECHDVDECSKNYPCAMYDKACINLEGGYICKCKSGFEQIDGGNCIDIDECKADPCAIFQGTCINVDGDYICQCGSAFQQISEKNCTDIDECKVSKTCNLRTSACNNLFGGYECTCLEGYFKMDEDLHSSCDVTSTSMETKVMQTLYVLIVILLVAFIIAILSFFLLGNKKE